MNESQRRAFAALGIGPLWRLRTAPARAIAAAPPAAQAHRLFTLSDTNGEWRFIAQSDAGPGGDYSNPLQPDAMRLLERMFVALGLRPAPRCDPFDSSVDPAAPRVLVALGEAAARALLDTDEPLDALRGRVHEARIGARVVPLVVSAHPSRLLEAPQEKAGAWADLCLARDALIGDS